MDGRQNKARYNRRAPRSTVDLAESLPFVHLKSVDEFGSNGYLGVVGYVSEEVSTSDLVGLMTWLVNDRSRGEEEKFWLLGNAKPAIFVYIPSNVFE
jgi:hypothetical protein